MAETPTGRPHRTQVNPVAMQRSSHHGPGSDPTIGTSALIAACAGTVVNVHELPVGWATELAVLRGSGAVLEDRREHLLVRSPGNPDFHWGNCIIVTEEDAIEDAGRWASEFRAAFPGASWVAIGLIRMPHDQDAWTAEGLDVELDDVLTARTLPRQTPLPDGYAVRRLSGQDWSQMVARAVAANERTHEHEAQSFLRFASQQARTRRELSERDGAAFFGAFADNTLVADLGIVRCGTTARYQSVSTDDEHRRRGLASHLLGVAARWSSDRGCDRWVILTEAANPAGRVYRALGFEPDTGTARAYRNSPP